MKKGCVRAAVVIALMTSGTAVKAADVLTGDTRSACEAILCLSSGTQPAECTPSLSRYFSITKRKLSDTIRARSSFLQLCPVANQTPAMASLVSAISTGAGRCDAASLNNTLRVWNGQSDSALIYVSNQLPDYCSAYTGHAYTDFNTSGATPRYVGLPERGGYWAEARDYARAVAEYNDRIRREDEERRRSSWWGN